MGAISTKGKFSIYLFINSLTKEEYVKILSKNFLMDWREISWKNFLFQCDNDPNHKNKLALEFYSKDKVDRLEWPSYSPDLNPIENVWVIVKQQVNKCDLSRISEVISKVKEIWSELDLEAIENAIQYMPIRLNKWIKTEWD